MILPMDSNWRPTSQLRFGMVAPQLLCWLTDTGSLTARLISACTGRFRVEVISQGYAMPFLNESRRMQLPTRQHALIREVYLYCDNVPWVFARTVIPRSTLSGPQKHLAHLGNKPLGAVLFADPHMQRDEIEVCQLNRGQSLHAHACARLPGMADALWGRRSVFYLQHKPLLVSEFFLPQIGQCPAPQR